MFHGVIQKINNGTVFFWDTVYLTDHFPGEPVLAGCTFDNKRCWSGFFNLTFFTTGMPDAPPLTQSTVNAVKDLVFTGGRVPSMLPNQVQHTEDSCNHVQLCTIQNFSSDSGVCQI